jgi:hypothetical protein
MPWTSGGGGAYGCTEFLRKAADGETSVNRDPGGVCRFDCVICYCDCKCVFMEHHRMKIATGIVREKVQLEPRLLKADPAFHLDSVHHD